MSVDDDVSVGDVSMHSGFKEHLPATFRNKHNGSMISDNDQDRLDF